MRTRSRAKTIYAYAVHAAFWLGLIGFGVFNLYALHSFRKQYVVVDAMSLAFSEGYKQVTFKTVMMLHLPKAPTYHACGTVDGHPAVFVPLIPDKLQVLGRDPAAAYRLRRLCESGRRIIF